MDRRRTGSGLARESPEWPGSRDSRMDRIEDAGRSADRPKAFACRVERKPNPRHDRRVVRLHDAVRNTRVARDTVPRGASGNFCDW